MITAFKKYITDNQLFTKKDRLLVAVSGGVDSIVLCHLLKLTGYNFALAHCNFQLRGSESESDEVFVKNYALKNDIIYFTKRFDTEGVASKWKKGIQETARVLRYDWFTEIMQNNDYQYLITAHHASDNIETFLFNLTRGTGLRGLKGILPKNENLVRPLLWAKKEDIIAFATIHKIAFREDSSNASDKYKRNYIRHNIIPSMQTINSHFVENATETINLLQDAQILLDFYIQDIALKITKNIDNQLFINRIALFQYPSVLTILFELLKGYNFNTSQIKQIIYDESDKTKVGITFYSATHVLLVDRTDYIIRPIEKNVEPFYYLISETDTFLQLPKAQLNIKKIDSKNLVLLPDKWSVLLDYEKLTFPLTLRHWQKGDFFHPLGMGGKKQKVSDFFKNQKLSHFEKGDVWVLTTAKNEICWLIGFRLDERFKLTDDTNHCLSINYRENS